MSVPRYPCTCHAMRKFKKYYWQCTNSKDRFASAFVQSDQSFLFTVELQWPEHLWNHENMFETGEVQANEC